jgi:hypothetical protein
MESCNPQSCCSDLFTDFTFQDLVRARPPRVKGVYAIRVKTEGVKTNIIIDKTMTLVTGIGWDLVKTRVLSRVNRLKRIGQCPIIYIGSAGTQPGSRNTLQGRYREFSSRHTAMYPIWSLLYFGWKLEYGWLAS